MGPASSGKCDARRGQTYEISKWVGPGYGAALYLNFEIRRLKNDRSVPRACLIGARTHDEPRADMLNYRRQQTETDKGVGGGGLVKVSDWV